MPVLTTTPTLELKPKTRRTFVDKEATALRLEQELEVELAYTEGQVRHIPPSPSGFSRNPNHVLAFNFVNDHFLNREPHEEAVATLEGWKPQPWKGQIWRGPGKNNIERVWTGPVHFDLVFDGREWLPCNTSHSSSVDLGAVDFNFPASGMREVTCGYQFIPGWGAKRAKAITIPRSVGESTPPVKKPKTLYGTARLKAEKELNSAYVLFEKDEEHKETFYKKLYVYVQGVRSNAIYLEVAERAEMYIAGEDILGEFLLKITSLIEKGKYVHQGKMENWLGYHWGNYHLPEIQTKIQSYLDRTTYVNQTDVGGGEDDEDKEHQNHSVAIVNTEEHQVRREQEGYYAPVSRDRIFRRLNKPTQAIVEMLAKGVSVSEVAVKLNISSRQLRRRADVAAEDGEAVLDDVLHTVQACLEQDNLVEWPEQVIDLQASAQEIFEPLLGVPEAAKLLCIHPKTLQALARAGSVPCIRMGKYWRFRESSLDTWVQDQLISDHQSRRAS